MQAMAFPRTLPLPAFALTAFTAFLWRGIGYNRCRIKSRYEVRPGFLDSVGLLRLPFAPNHMGLADIEVPQKFFIIVVHGEPDAVVAQIHRDLQIFYFDFHFLSHLYGMAILPNRSIIAAPSFAEKRAIHG
jgi:hypothetical protein